MKFARLNEEPIAIERVEDEHEAARDYTPSFWWWNRRYYLEDFTHVHNNPFMGVSEYPEYIHMIEAEKYVRPLLIELVGNTAVNVYEERDDA